jgi:hypothetical protein
LGFWRSKKKCHPDRSVAQWRDLLFIIAIIESEWKRRPPLCHPDRTRISCHAALDKAAYAAFVKESSMKCINATKVHRKSGGA